MSKIEKISMSKIEKGDWVCFKDARYFSGQIINMFVVDIIMTQLHERLLKVYWYKKDGSIVYEFFADYLLEFSRGTNK